jgi:phosphoglycerol transferase
VSEDFTPTAPIEIVAPEKIVRLSTKATFRTAIQRMTLKEPIRIAALALLMIVLWCKVYRVNSFADLNVPRGYGGDGAFSLAMIKAYRDGEISPFTFQIVRSLNAPFRANWNDYPTTEKLLPYCVGITARFIGLMAAFNLAGLTAIVLAAIGFYITCRLLHYKWMFSFMGAVMFGFSHYMSGRFLAHLSLTYYWHIPLFLLVTWWCVDSKSIPIGSLRWWFAAAVGVATGMQAIYYAFMFWQFLGFAMLAQVVRRNRSKLISVASIASISVASTVLLAAPYVLYRFENGPNSSIVQRDLSNLQIYALQLPELFLSPYHRWKAFATFSQTHFFLVSLIRGEGEFPYLGLVGIAGFLWLIGYGVVRLLQDRAKDIPVMFWQSLWIMLFSLVGGVNLLVGVAGLQLFRGTNRFSIVLLCLSLFFLVRQLGRMCPPQFRVLLSLLLLGVGLWDILPPFMARDVLAYNKAVVASDQNFVLSLERMFPPGTMLFQEPVMEFPEVPPHLAINDYTYLRPYFFSRNLRFSYGSDKGRALETWQHDVENLPPREMVHKLEQYGFGAIIVDRKGYADGAAALLGDLEANGRRVVQQDLIGEFVAVALRPRSKVMPPEIPPFPGPGFYGWEGDWRQGAQSWSQGNATLIFTNDSTTAMQKHYTFVLGSLTRRRLRIVAPHEEKAIELIPGAPATAGPFELQLAPGVTKVQFETDSPGVPAGGSDPRTVAFSVAIQPEPSDEATPVLGPGFNPWEGDWRRGGHSWSQGPATLFLDNPNSKAVSEQFSFLLTSTTRRHVSITTPAGKKTLELIPGTTTTAGPYDFQLTPGRTNIRFDTDRPAVTASAQDQRKIAFSVAVVAIPSDSLN